MKPLQMASLTAGMMLAFNLAAQTNTNEVTVKVQDLAGKPIAGATVEYYTFSAFDQKAREPKTKTTGSDGTAKVAVTQDASLLVARKQGMSICGACYSSANESQGPVLILDQPFSISGILVDESDKPVPDAKVGIAMICFRPPTSPSTSLVDTESVGDLLSTRTGTDGRFRIEGLPTNSTVNLFAIKPGKALMRERWTVDAMMGRAGQQDIKLKMLPGGKIEGKVVIPGGVKMSDVHLALLNESTPVQTQPGPDGSFRFEDVAAGSYKIFSFFGTNKHPEWVAETVTASVEAGQVTRDVTITAVKGGVLEVAVFSRKGHKPLADVSVYVGEPNGFSRTGTTGADGLEYFRAVPGHYNVSANKDNAQAQQSSVNIEEGQTNRVELELIPPPQISGTVRDTNGAPLAGVEVRNIPGWGDSAVKTDTHGHFEMNSTNLRQGGPGAVPFLLVRDRERNLAAACEIQEETETYDLRLAPGLVLSGKVQNEQGKPLTNAVVKWVAWGGNTGSWMDETNPPTIDAEGRFEVRALPVGRRYSVDVTAKGYGATSSRIGEYDANSELEPFVLRVADKKIAGVVVDSEDKPVLGAQVYTYGTGQPQITVQTDEKGRFVVDGVCEGTINLNASVQTPVFSYGNLRVEGGDTNIIVRVRQQGSGVNTSQPRRASLVGKPLPDLTAAGISADALQTNKPKLICLFDPDQRPSRRAIRLLADQNDALKQKGVTVVGVSAALTTADALKEWKQTNPTPFAIGGVTEKNDKTQWILKTEKFPWLILTDAQGRVTAEGFDLDELDAKLK